MPSRLVNRYAIYFRLPDQRRVRQTIARDPSLLIAIESCLAAYRDTGHLDYLIEDEGRKREFSVDRDILLRLLFLKHNDSTRYFELLNRLDRSGAQDDLVSFLRANARL